MRAIVLWLLHWLEESLDPDLKVRVEALRNKAAALEAERAQLLAEIQASQLTLADLSLTLAEDLARRKELEDAIARSNEETARKVAELDGLRGGNRVRVDL
jgi:chromosome segregation ATPase